MEFNIYVSDSADYTIEAESKEEAINKAWDCFNARKPRFEVKEAGSSNEVKWKNSAHEIRWTCTCGLSVLEPLPASKFCHKCGRKLQF